MPSLSAKKLVDLTLPSSTSDDPAKVTVNTTITTSQALKAAEAEENRTALMELIADSIVGWNFTKEDGSEETITAEAVGRLDLKDFTFLAETISAALEESLGQKAVGTDEKKV